MGLRDASASKKEISITIIDPTETKKIESIYHSTQNKLISYFTLSITLLLSVFLFNSKLFINHLFWIDYRHQNVNKLPHSSPIAIENQICDFELCAWGFLVKNEQFVGVEEWTIERPSRLIALLLSQDCISSKQDQI